MDIDIIHMDHMDMDMDIIHITGYVSSEIQ